MVRCSFTLGKSYNHSLWSLQVNRICYLVRLLKIDEDLANGESLRKLAETSETRKQVGKFMYLKIFVDSKLIRSSFNLKAQGFSPKMGRNFHEIQSFLSTIPRQFKIGSVLYHIVSNILFLCVKSMPLLYPSHTWA